MSSYLLFGGLTFVLAVLFVYLVLLISRKKALYDHIDERKIHTGQIPRLGGVGFITAYVGMVLFLTLLGVWNQYTGLSFILLLIAMVLILVFGIWDDLKPLRARYKFGIQVLAAILVSVAGYRFTRITFGTNEFSLVLGWFSWPLTILWIVGIINAINLIDGVDGLSGGISIIILLSYSLVYSYYGNIHAAALSLLLVAAILGFLVFNFPAPQAKIFMGDTGSQFLGFFIALIPLMETPSLGYSRVALPYAAGLTLIPIFDTFAAIWRRTRDSKKIYEPDREHTHHKLLALGLSSLQIDLVLYSVQLISGILITLALTILKAWRIPLLIGAYLVVAAFFTILHFAYRDRVKRGNGK
ncbi:MAG: MraY family glycosyltransferase [Clostridiaceae bacterium]